MPNVSRALDHALPDGGLRGRRVFLALMAAAGVAPAVQAAVADNATLGSGESADMTILQAAIALEHHAVALYDFGLGRGLVPQGLKRYAVEFRGDHQGHRDTQISLVEERGGQAPTALDRYAFGAKSPGDAFLREALEIEVAAQRAYQALASQIRTRDYLLSAAFILVDEVRHATVWRRVLGLGTF